MENQLLTAKLRIPAAPHGLVSRPRLLARLNEGLSRHLVLISAAPGSGKTSLLSEWLNSLAFPVAWLTLDDDDNDPALFLAYLVAALEKALPAIQISSHFHPHSSAAVPLDKTMTILINELEQFQNQFVLVLDDYHVINDPSIHRAMSVLLDRQPLYMHTVIATRIDPPLPVALMRGRGQMTELRADDLRFTHSETHSFLQQSLGLELSNSDIVSLENRTEGWAAGLQLAAVSLQGRADASRFIREFSGSNRFVLDYLMEEVLQRQPPPIQTFLLQTSILDRFCASLCSSLTEMSDSQAVIESLEHSNLFIIPLDDQRQWYRFHHLFADLLHQRLYQVHPDHTALHNRASLWFEQNGFITEAIDQAISAEDFDRAAGLINEHAEAYILKDQVITLKRWLELFPGDLLLKYPGVGLYYVWTLVFIGNVFEGEKILNSLMNKMSEEDNQSEAINGEINIARAILYIYQGKFQLSAELIQHAMDHLPSEKTLVRGIAGWLLSFTTQWNNPSSLMPEPLKKTGVENNKGLNNALLINFTTYTIGVIQAMRGLLKEAQKTFQTGLDLMGDSIVEILSKDPTLIPPSTGLILQGFGDLLREQNDLKNAQIYLKKAIELGQLWGNGEVLADMYIALAKTNLALNNPDEAQAAINGGLAFKHENKISPITGLQLEAWQAWIWTACGRMEEAEAWITSFHPGFPIVEQSALMLSYWNSLIVMVKARVQRAKGKFTEAVPLLLEAIESAVSSDWMVISYQLNLQLACCYVSLGDEQKAFQRLELTLIKAAPEGLVRTFLDEGCECYSLLLKYDRTSHPQGLMGAYVHRLLAAFEGQKNLPSAQPGMIEPLSERELQVLAFLSAGLSNRDIADRIVTAVSTVKSHTNAIYRKLNVSTRTQAIARARELKLI